MKGQRVHGGYVDELTSLSKIRLLPFVLDEGSMLWEARCVHCRGSGQFIAFEKSPDAPPTPLMHRCAEPGS